MHSLITAEKLDNSYQIKGLGYNFTLSVFEDSKANLTFLKGSTLLFKDEIYDHEFILLIKDSANLPNEHFIQEKISRQIQIATDTILEDRHMESLKMKKQNYF